MKDELRPSAKDVPVGCEGVRLQFRYCRGKRNAGTGEGIASKDGGVLCGDANLDGSTEAAVERFTLSRCVSMRDAAACRAPGSTRYRGPGKTAPVNGASPRGFLRVSPVRRR